LANPPDRATVAPAPQLTDILDWFLAAFPIRRDEDKAELARLRELV
jgi:hypothetical protein